MESSIELEGLKYLIRKGEIQTVFDRMSKIFIDSDLENEYTQLSFRFNEIQRDKLLGTHEPDQIEVRLNKLIVSLLEFIDYSTKDSTKESVKTLKKITEQFPALKRVCFISSEYPPHFLGGLGVHVYNLSKYLSKHISVDVILPSQKTDYNIRVPNVDLKPLSKIYATYENPVSWLRYSEFAAQKINRLRPLPDILHAHDWVTVLAGIKSRWEMRIPLVYHLHLPNKDILCSSIENLGLICADLITVNSESMYEEIRERKLPISAKIKIIPNGVDTDVYYPSDGWPDNDNYILYVGRLAEQKGIYYLLHAYCYIKEKFPDIMLKIVGEGPIFPDLKRLSENLLISEHVQFLGKLEGKDLTLLYQNAQIVVIPSIYEPFGMTALEAMACKRPVVATRVGGLMEIVEHNKNGFLFENRDYLDLAQWLMTLLASPNLQHKFANYAFPQIKEKGYLWPDVAKNYLEEYNDIILNIPFEPNQPEKSSEFVDQIIHVAKEHPHLDKTDDSLFVELFNWVDK